MKGLNPCLSCGACCESYRVSFYWAETEPDLQGSVPIELTEKISPFLRCMKGTNQKPVRCAALEGIVGEFVRCTIYDQRPSTCTNFGIHWKNGKPSAKLEEQMRCNKARRIHHLEPLFHITPVKIHAGIDLRTIYPKPFSLPRKNHLPIKSLNTIVRTN
jgi:Fe-S-cluster containining protein